ncbi:MAG: flagellar filament capping protein FliD, partial [Syntrophomonadaceae bacterium]|nr:flagellar filament capping protein FliD [Syntrophomonadaceae bacterium]
MNGINPIRFGGIASGLDTESIIKNLMKIEQIKVDRNVQQKQILEWKRDDYRDINTKLLALRNSTFDLKLQGTFMTKKANSSDETCLTATAGAEAVEGNYQVEVVSLASGVTAASSAALESNATKTTLKDQFTGIADKISFTLENKVDESQTFTFNTAEKSIYDVIRSINDAGIGIKASYDEGTDRFFLMTANTGSEAKISVTKDESYDKDNNLVADKSFLRDTLKIYSGNLPTDGTPISLGTGTDAEIKFNGITGLKFSSNQFNFNNINFNLKKTDTVDLSISYNTDAVVDKIKSFVENYNTIMENISTKMSEKRYRDFPPLTAEQKKDMDEKDIELWEEKARSGLFRADSMLSGIASDLRTSTGSAVKGLTGDYKTLSSIGISTGAWYDQGKLYVDETKLKKAL